VKGPREKRDKEGIIEVYNLRLYGPLLIPFLEHAAEGVRAEPAEVRLEDKRIAVKTDGIKVAVEFKLLKGRRAVMRSALKASTTTLP